MLNNSLDNEKRFTYDKKKYYHLTNYILGPKITNKKLKGRNSMKANLQAAEITDQILKLLKELVPDLDPLKIKAEDPLLPQLDLPQDEFQKLQGMIYDMYGAHLPLKYFTPSFTLMEIVHAVRNVPIYNNN